MKASAGWVAGTQIPLPRQARLDVAPQHPEGADGRFYKVEKNTLVWSAMCPKGEQRAVYKMYRNRGPVSWQREKAFQFRVQREYEACVFLEKNELATTPALCWFFGQDEEHGRYEVLCMRELSGAEALTDLVNDGRKDQIDFQKMFKTFREMHRVGFYHGRLDLRNVMGMPGDDGELVYVIMDTPQAITYRNDLFGTRMGWYDMQQISYYTHDYLDDEACVALLIKYGLGEGDAVRMLQLVKRGEVPRNTRNFLRFEFGMRARFGQ